MARIEHLSIIPDNANLRKVNNELLISPKSDCSVSEINQKVKLTYSIRTSGVNLEIVKPQKDLKIPGVKKVFNRLIKFKKINSGTKKNFIVRCAAELNGSSDWDEILVNYV